MHVYLCTFSCTLFFCWFFSALVGFFFYSVFHFHLIVFYVYVCSGVRGCLGACAGVRVCVYVYILYVCVCIGTMWYIYICVYIYVYIYTISFLLKHKI